MSLRLRTFGKGRRELLKLPLLVGALGVGAVLARRWPTDHTLRIVLGDTAPLATDVRIRYAPRDGDDADRDWQREVRLHFGAGRAPRVVRHEPRLASGDYDVEVEVDVTRADAAPRTARLQREVVFGSEAATVDVSAAVRDSLSEPPRP